MSNLNADLVADYLQRSEYRDGDVLSAAALARDAEANLAAWLKHQTVAHTGGIIGGLLVTYDATEIIEPPGVEPQNPKFKVNFNVSPGAAIDSQGRMILVDQVLDHHIENIAKEDYYALWLKSEIQEVSVAGSEFNRYQETPILEISLIDSTHGECDNEISSGVLLAILCKSSKEFIIDSCCRRYVAAVGHRVTAPSKRAEMILGPQSANDPRRFAIGVQAGPKDSIRDVITWEDTGTIRFSTQSSLANPPEKSAEVLRPPIMSIGAPSVYVKPEDILDSCEIWKKLIRLNNFKELFSECEQSILTSPPACLEKLKHLLVRYINRLLRRSTEDVYAIPYGKYQPHVDDFVLHSGQLLKVVEVDYENQTCDLSDSAEFTFYFVSWLDVSLLWSSQSILNRFHTDYKIRLNIPSHRWKYLSGGLVCRLLLDEYLGDSIRHLPDVAKRGLYFMDSAPAEKEAGAGRIHLVEFKKEDKTYKQLRITIPDPGKENHPERYRCSIGTTTDCNDPPIPDFAAGEKAIWNRQTSRPRGILSVLADKSVDIHKQLNVYPNQISRKKGKKGLVVKVEPTDASVSAASAVVSTPILTNAVAWNGQKVIRSAAEKLQLGGSLKNITDLNIDSLQVIVSIYGKDDSDHEPEHNELVLNTNQLLAGQEISIASLIKPPITPEIKIITEVFKTKTVVISLLVMGVNRQDAIICTQYREEHPKP